MLCAWPQNITSYELENSGLAVWDLQKRKWSTRKASKPHTSWSIRPDCLLLRWHCVKGPPPWLSRKLERQIYNFVYILYIYIYIMYIYIYKFNQFDTCWYCLGKVLLTRGLTADGYWSRKNKSDPYRSISQRVWPNFGTAQQAPGHTSHERGFPITSPRLYSNLPLCPPAQENRVTTVNALAEGGSCGTFTHPLHQVQIMFIKQPKDVTLQTKKTGL